MGLIVDATGLNIRLRVGVSDSLLSRIEYGYDLEVRRPSGGRTATAYEGTFWDQYDDDQSQGYGSVVQAEGNFLAMNLGVKPDEQATKWTYNYDSDLVWGSLPYELGSVYFEANTYIDFAGGWSLPQRRLLRREIEDEILAGDDIIEGSLGKFNPNASMDLKLHGGNDKVIVHTGLDNDVRLGDGKDVIIFGGGAGTVWGGDGDDLFDLSNWINNTKDKAQRSYTQIRIKDYNKQEGDHVSLGAYNMAYSPWEEDGNLIFPLPRQRGQLVLEGIASIDDVLFAT